MPIRFESSIQNRIGRPIRFEIRFERKKNDSQVPTKECRLLAGNSGEVHHPALSNANPNHNTKHYR